MNQYSCEFIDKGLYVSHRGTSLCCVNEQIEKPTQLPSKFWNSKKRQQAIIRSHKDMPVDGCASCYRLESKKLPSNRTRLKKHNSLPTKDLPVLLDLDFSNLCNLKCIMCNSERSSELAKDKKLYVNNKGVSQVSKQVIDDLINISAEVKEIQIQGGEPSIMEDNNYYFQRLDEKGYSKNITVLININGTNLNKKFCNSLKNFKSVRLSVSIDSYGLANNYIRWPSKFEAIDKNVRALAKYKNFHTEVFSTINVLSLFDYKNFLFWCKEMESFYATNGKTFRVTPSKILNPIYYSPFIATNNLKDYFIHQINDFLQYNNLTHNSKWKLEMLMFLKSLKEAKTNHNAIKQLMYQVKYLDEQRNTSIEHFIPNFSLLLDKNPSKIATF